MKKYVILMLTVGLVAIGAGMTNAHATAVTSTTTTVQTPEQPPLAATTTTTTETTVQAPPMVAAPPPAVVAPVVEEKPTARDAITGKPVDTSVPAKEEEKKSLRDEVREKISEEAGAK